LNAGVCSNPLRARPVDYSAASFFWFGHNETTADLWPVFKPLRPRWLTWFYRNASNFGHILASLKPKSGRCAILFP
jgi:hypothetical protein